MDGRSDKLNKANDVMANKTDEKRAKVTG